MAPRALQRMPKPCSMRSTSMTLAPPSAAVTAAGRPEQPAPTTSTSTSTTSDELTLTRNTVKTYIKRIYGKLGVHSQQELIDLVEAGAGR